MDVVVRCVSGKAFFRSRNSCLRPCPRLLPNMGALITVISPRAAVRAIQKPENVFSV